jgi:hypothetical protein
MPLTLRRTGPASPADRELDDWTIFSGQWAVGRVYEERGALPEVRWHWSFFGSVSRPAEMSADGRAPTLETAKIQFAENWRKWLAWTALVEGTRQRRRKQRG